MHVIYTKFGVQNQITMMWHASRPVSVYADNIKKINPKVLSKLKAKNVG